MLQTEESVASPAQKSRGRQGYILRSSHLVLQKVQVDLKHLFSTLSEKMKAQDPRILPLFAKE